LVVEVFGRDFWGIPGCVLNSSPAPFAVPSLIGLTGPLATDLKFTIYIQHLAEHIPVVSPLGKKHIGQRHDSPKECIPHAVFGFYLRYQNLTYAPCPSRIYTLIP
jgi:hypothetical protein